MRRLLILLLVVACSRERIRGGEVTIRNDILDKEYNVIAVDQITTLRGTSSKRLVLRPGEQQTLPFKQITGLRFTRRYKDFSRVYLVECPSNLDRRVTIKLIDVHLNRVSGGCDLVRRGEIRDGFTKWE